MPEHRPSARRALLSVKGSFVLLIAVPALVVFGGRADAGVTARFAGAPADAAANAAAGAPAGEVTITPPGAGILAQAGQSIAPARQQPLFDPKADPAADLMAAILEARRTGRRIMLDVGGNWCPWCLVLHRYLHDDPALKAFVAEHYVWVRVNYSRENKNENFLSRYPGIKGYPHLFVLDSDGKLLHSQDTSLLEQGNSYSNEKMWAFLRQWASGATARSQRD